MSATLNTRIGGSSSSKQKNKIKSGPRNPALSKPKPNENQVVPSASQANGGTADGSPEQPAEQQLAVVDSAALGFWFSAAKYVPMTRYAGLTFDANHVPELRQWDPMLNMAPDATIVCFGKRRTGKSFMTRWILFLYKDFFPRGIVFSETDRLNEFYRDFMPKRFIFPDMENEKIDTLIEHQTKIKTGPDHEHNLTIDENYLRSVVVFDDVISSESMVRFSKPLSALFVQGRHLDLMTVFNTQYPKALSPKMRTNTDIAILFVSTDADVREALYKIYGQAFGSQDMFLAVLDKYTEDNMALICDLTDNKCTQVVERFYWYKASDPGDFLFGCEEFHQGPAGGQDESFGVNEVRPRT